MSSRQELMMINLALKTQELIMKEDMKTILILIIIIRKNLRFLKFLKVIKNWKKELLVWKITIYIAIWIHVYNVFFQLMSYGTIIYQNNTQNLIIWGQFLIL